MAGGQTRGLSCNQDTMMAEGSQTRGSVWYYVNSAYPTAIYNKHSILRLETLPEKHDTSLQTTSGRPKKLRGIKPISNTCLTGPDALWYVVFFCVHFCCV